MKGRGHPRERAEWIGKWTWRVSTYEGSGEVDVCHVRVAGGAGGGALGGGGGEVEGSEGRKEGVSEYSRT